MSSKTEKSREEILAERQQKKKQKAALKNQLKEKSQKPEKDTKDLVTNTSNISKNVIDSKNKSKQGEKKSESKVLIVSSEQQKSNKFVNAKESTSTTVLASQNVKIDVKSGVGDFADAKHTSSVLSSGDQKSEINKVAENVKNQSASLNKVNNENTITGEAAAVKTKAQLKAERRAKQEAERARKLEKATNAVVQEKKVSKPPIKTVEPVKKPSTVPTDIHHKVKLFAHLYNPLPDTDVIDSPVQIHPSIIQLGAQYSSRVVSGANACCLALLNALKKVVMDFEIPQKQEFSRGLEAEITKSMNYLKKLRPLAVSMVNVVKHLKFQVSQSKGTEVECKNNINEWIDTYIKEQLEMAAKAICLFVREKISPGDVILTYGCCSLIQQILISVHKEGINFQVIVVDGRPRLEGREMLKKLVSVGIHCTYVFVNGLSFIMPEVTKILLGADALLANGYVMSQVGSSQIALLAKAYNVPVLVCCETYKFSERVQTDSFVYNELGNPNELVSNKGCLSKELSKWKSIQYLTPLNLTYDVTPPDLVTAVVTELAVLPCTSVPVILRIKPPDVFG